MLVLSVGVVCIGGGSGVTVGFRVGLLLPASAAQQPLGGAAEARGTAEADPFFCCELVSLSAAVTSDEGSSFFALLSCLFRNQRFSRVAAGSSNAGLIDVCARFGTVP